MRMVVTALAAVVAITLMWSACSGQSFFSGDVSPCFTALPAAKDAVHGKGKFVGVRRLTPAELKETFPILTQRSPDLGKKAACIVAYEGLFQPSQVVDPRPPNRPGHFALVVITYPGKQAVATVLRDRLPAGFRSAVGRVAHR
jgi:hypothetical protein